MQVNTTEITGFVLHSPAEYQECRRKDVLVTAGWERNTEIEKAGMNRGRSEEKWGGYRGGRIDIVLEEPDRKQSWAWSSGLWVLGMAAVGVKVLEEEASSWNYLQFDLILFESSPRAAVCPDWPTNWSFRASWSSWCETITLPVSHHTARRIEAAVWPEVTGADFSPSPPHPPSASALSIQLCRVQTAPDTQEGWDRTIE